MDEHQFNAIKILATDTDHRAIGKVVIELDAMMAGSELARVPKDAKESFAEYRAAEEAVLSWAETNGRGDIDRSLAFEGIPLELESRFRAAAVDYCLSGVDLD